MKKFTQNRGIAQLVEYRSPKPWVVGSSPSAPAKKKRMVSDHPFLFAYGHMVERTLGEQSEPRRRLLANSRRVLPRQARQGSEPFVFLWSTTILFFLPMGIWWREPSANKVSRGDVCLQTRAESCRGKRGRVQSPSCFYGQSTILFFLPMGTW